MTVWADGSAWQNPGPGGYAALIVTPEGSLRETVAGFHPFTTNIRMELTGVIAALRKLPRGMAVTVYTDCHSVAEGLAGRTRRTAHGDLWEWYEETRAGRAVAVRWIPSQAGLPWHRQADALARRMTAEGYHGGHSAPVALCLGADAAPLSPREKSVRLIGAVCEEAHHGIPARGGLRGHCRRRAGRTVGAGPA